MRWKAVVCAAGFAPLAGCNLAYYAGYNLVNESVTRLDEVKLSKRLRAEARVAWQEVIRQYPQTFTEEFRDGFTDGYADYLEVGGIPQPPAFPPPRYRRSQYFSPEGQARVKDYLAGFKYGAEVAYATGRREFLTVPILLPDPPSEPMFNIQLPAPPGVGPDCPPPAEAAPLAPAPGTVVPPPIPTPAGPPVPAPAGPPVPGPAGTPDPGVPLPRPTPLGPSGLGNPVPQKNGGAIPPKPKPIPDGPLPPVSPPELPGENRPQPMSLRPTSATAGPGTVSATPPPARPPVPDTLPAGRPPAAGPPAPAPATPDPRPGG
jgi:hypothetical protein